ncbi:MAG TPA: hypothetical protein VMW89_14960 [Desulfatiglandales bacterium]|nr:hypothetical protein [Desulfatiglandales bacterium]
MSCYFRHLKDIFNEAGLEVTKENKKEIDRLIHGLVKVEYKNCSAAWKAIKEQIRRDDTARSTFIEDLKRELNGEMNVANAQDKRDVARRKGAQVCGGSGHE